MDNQKHPDGIIGSLCAIGCETLYGLSYIFTKQATVCASEFALLGWRFFIAVIIMSLCILFGFIKIDLKGKSKKPLLLVAFCNPCIYFLAETIGISNTTASESGIFLACIPVASLIFSTILLKKRPSKIQMIGIWITLLGVIVTVFAVVHHRVCRYQVIHFFLVRLCPMLCIVYLLIRLSNIPGQKLHMSC